MEVIRISTRCNASYTVEAAFIIPLVLGIIFSIMCYAFYYHDKVILNQEIYHNMIMWSQDLYDYDTESEYIQDLQMHMWILHIESGKMNKRLTNVTSKVKANYNINVPIMGMFLKPRTNLIIKNKYSLVKPADTVRYRNVSNDEGG